MNDKIKGNLEFLLAFYNATQSEITRYRDKEWAMPGIFIAAMGAVIGFVVANEKESRNLWLAFDVVLIVLAVGNAFYTLFMHTKLTEQRNVMKRLQYLMGLHKIKIGKQSLVPFEASTPKDDNFLAGWMNGFWSHVFPFLVAGMALCGFGIWLLHRC